MSSKAMLEGDHGETSGRRKVRRFEVPARLDAVLAQVLDGVEPSRERSGPKLPERYVLIDAIGRGAQSHVYSVFDREMNCKSALKVFNDGGGGRGYREAQALSGVAHANVVRVQDVGMLDDRVYLRMDFVDGTTLREWAKNRTWREKLAAYIQAGRGLAAAHKVGIVHRDFKPDNALVRDADATVVVVDFGLALGLFDPHDVPKPEPAPTTSTSQAVLDPLSRSGQLQGTPAYMAPEQFQRESVDARTDQFSFCIALYEALDGARPFEGNTIAELALRVTTGEIKGPPRHAPQWVWRVLRRGLSRDPQQRYASMGDLLDDLENDPRKWMMRVGVALAVLATIAGAWKLWEIREERHSTRQAQLQAEYDEERAQKEAAERRLRDRGDALTLRECSSVMGRDPTKAVARLATLSEDSKLWGAGARMLASDAAHRGVATEFIDIAAAQVPHGLSPDGAIAVTREPSTGTVSLHWIADGRKAVLGDALFGLPVVAFSPDGTSIAAQRVPQGVRVWNTSSLGEPAVSLGSSPDEHHRMIFGPGNPGVITFGRNAEVIRWHDGAQVLGGHEGRVDEVAVDDAGDYAATVDGVRHLRLWNLRTSEARELAGFGPIAFSADGRLAAADRADCERGDRRPQSLIRIVIPGAPGGQRLCTGHDVPLTSIAFSPTNRWVAGGLADGRVLVWNLGTTERIDLARPDGETGELRFVSEEVLGSKSPDTTLVVWSLPNRRSHVLRGHVGIAHWARRFDGTIVTFGHEGEIRAWTLPDARDRSLRSHSGPVAHVAYSAHGLVTAGSDGDVRVWPPDEHEDDRLVSDENDPVVTFAVAPRGDRVAIGRANGDVAITELGGNKATALAQTGQVFGVAWDREGRRLAIAGRSGGVDVVDTMTGETSLEIREPDAYRVRAAHFSRGGRVLATVGWVDDGIVWIRMFDARTGALQEKHPVEATGVEAAAFSHDDRYVAINSFERTVLVWDRHSGVRTFGKHAGQVGGVDISPDSSRLITAGTDGVVKLWDLASGLHRTVQLRGPLRGVAFALDGKTFTAVGDARVAFFGRDDLPQDPAQLRAWVLRATNMRVQPSDLDLDGSSL